MSEKSLYNTLKRNWERFGVHLTRIETNTTAGIPDAYLVYREGRSAWLELKYGKRKRRTQEFKIRNLRPAQCNVLERWWRAGINTYILYQINDDLLVIPGHLAHRVRIGDVAYEELSDLGCRWYKSPIDYATLLADLVRR